jgi:hypothetical protein
MKLKIFQASFFMNDAEWYLKFLGLAAKQAGLNIPHIYFTEL